MKRVDSNELDQRTFPSKIDKDGVTFTVFGNPLPKQSFKHKGGQAYTPARIKAWQDTVGWAAREAMAGQEPFEGSLYAELTFIRGDKRRVDLDNLSKAVLDGCNKIVWVDDQQVFTLFLSKGYDKDHPAVIIKVGAI